MQESSKQNYLHGAAIMAAGVVVIKILGAIYKIPLGNILGDEGYGYFSVAYNIYNVFLTMATAGMPVALSRMISEADTLGRPMQARKIFRVAWLTFATIGLILGLVMFLFPTELAGMLNNVRAAQSIWALSPALVLVYLTSTYRGYAQGMSNMKPTTVSQILEVVGKVTVGLVLAWSFTRAGKSLPVASAGAIFGVTGGVMEAAVRTVYHVVTGKELGHVVYEPARGREWVKEGTVDLGEKGKVKIAVVHGLAHVEQILEDIREGKCDYHFIEVMACPGGCVDGGGTIREKNSYLDKLDARTQSIYKIDAERPIRQSHRNPDVIRLYEEFLEKPLSHRAETLLHTNYKDRQQKRRNPGIAEIWEKVRLG